MDSLAIYTVHNVTILCVLHTAKLQKIVKSVKHLTSVNFSKMKKDGCY